MTVCTATHSEKNTYGNLMVALKEVRSVGFVLSGS